MKSDIKAKIYRKAANKAAKRKNINFWYAFKKEIDLLIYKNAYQTAFEPNQKNLNERKYLIELQEIAVIKIKNTLK